MKLQSSPKVFEGYKSDRPERTIARIESAFKEIGFEVSYRQKDVGGELLFSGSARIEGLGCSTNGKGLTPVLAQASGYAELAERFSSCSLFSFSQFGDLLAKHDLLFRGLPGDYSLVGALADFTHRAGHVTKVDEPTEASAFDGHIMNSERLGDLAAQIAAESKFQCWVDAHSLTEGKTVKVPYKLVKTVSGTNGLAAGNSLEEAIVQGACEVFERYAAVTICKEQRRVPTIDAGSLEDPRIHKCLDIFRSLGVSVKFKDFSLGNRFPVVAAVFTNKGMEAANPLNKDVNHRHLSVGANFDLEDAIVRCLTEEVQCYSRDEYMREAEYDLLWEHLGGLGLKHPYAPARSILVPAEFRLFLQRYLTVGDLDYLEEDEQVIPLDALRFRRMDDFAADIDRVVEICKENGKKAYVVDHTHPVLGFPTVRVVIPGWTGIFSHVFEENGVRSYAQFRHFFENLWYEGLVDVVRAAFTERPVYKGFIESMERHLASYPFDHGLSMRGYGLRDTSIYDVLSAMSLHEGDFNRARRYSMFCKAMFGGKVTGVCSDTPSNGNPFVVTCKCRTCQVERPRLLDKVLRCFF